MSVSPGGWALLLAASTACLEAPPGPETEPMIIGRFVARELGAVNLTARGTIDWAHWGHFETGDYNHKSGVTPAIANFSQLGGSPVQRLACCSDFSWSDGTPTSSATNAVGGIMIDTEVASGDGILLTVAADTAPRTLTLFVGGWCARFQLSAELPGAPPYTHDAFEQPVDTAGTAVYELDFAAASAGDTLTITYLIAENHCRTGDLGEAWLIAAALFAAAPQL